MRSQLTNNLRFVVRKVQGDHVQGNIYTVKQVMILQQASQNMDTGELVWNDVPVEDE